MRIFYFLIVLITIQFSLGNNVWGQTFTKISTNFQGTLQEIVDFNLDGNIDLIYNKNDSVFLYINQGNLNFELTKLDIKFGQKNTVSDYDHDGDYDLIISKQIDVYSIVDIYNNNGNIFTKFNYDIDAGVYAEIKFKDYDQDSDLDLFMNCMIGTFNGLTLVYNNAEDTAYNQDEIELNGYELYP